MPLAAAIPALIGAGTSIVGGIMGSHAAGTAAQAQTQAAQQGMNIARTNLGGATTAQAQALSQTGQLFQPYTAAGAGGINALSAYLQPGGQLTQGWNQPFVAPTAQNVEATPGFQFQMQQGENAINASAAARGSLLTGGTAKALTQYGQGLASTNYQQAYNNAWNNYLNNQNTFYQNQANLYQRQMGLAGLGGQFASQYGGQQQQAAQNYANIYGQNTQAMANLLGAQGTAQATGAVGAANAWGGALGNVGQTATNLGLLNYLYPGLSAGGGLGGTRPVYTQGYGTNPPPA